MPSEIWVIHPSLDSWNYCLPSSKIYANLHTCRSWHREQLLFWKWRLIRPRLILKNRQPSLMVHTIPEIVKLRIWSTSHKHVINIIMWFRDMGCYNSLHAKMCTFWPNVFIHRVTLICHCVAPNLSSLFLFHLAWWFVSTLHTGYPRFLIISR
jgi:hypothetical protein